MRLPTSLPSRFLAALVLLSAIMPPQRAEAEAARTRAPQAPASVIAVEPFAQGLEHPWSLAFLPDGRLLVTERPGRMRIIARDGLPSPPLEGVPEVAATGQGGLLDVVLAPDFGGSGTIFFSFAEPRGDRRNATAVARARLIAGPGAGRLADVQIVFRQEPPHRGGLHFGSRLAFDRDGQLFVTLGERFEMVHAQSLERHWGKVVRIAPDGRAAAGNPFLQRPDVLPEIYSTGHRNPQAAAIHPASGLLWVVEHGPRGGDEVNVVRAGRNYGWPLIGYGIDYSGQRLHETTHKQGLEQPAYYWVPSIAPSGMAFYDGALFPAWRGNLFVGALAGKALHRLVLDGETIVAEEVLLKDLGERIRDVRQGPDGALWLLTDDANGRVLRIVTRN